MDGSASIIAEDETNDFQQLHYFALVEASFRDSCLIDALVRLQSQC